MSESDRRAMRFEIEWGVFELFPGMRIPAVYAEGIDPEKCRDAIGQEWRRIWAEKSEAAAMYGNAQSHPRVKPWRERFQAAGFSGKKFPSSIEAMLRRALKNGDPFSINPLVDLYNIVSMRHLVPAGGFDVDALEGERLDLRLTREGDTFHALDSDEVEDVPAGEIAYATGDDILTRHFVWKQSRRALLTPDTTRAIFMAEVLGEVGDDVADAVLDDLCSSIERYLGASTSGTTLSASNLAFDYASSMPPGGDQPSG